MFYLWNMGFGIWAELLNNTEGYMPGEEPVVIYQKSNMMFFAYFIPIFFLLVGIIVFMGVISEKWCSPKNDMDQIKAKFKNYGTYRNLNIRLSQYCHPPTSRTRSLSDGDVNKHETLNKELAKRLEGDNTKALPFESRRGKKNKRSNIVQIV